MRRSSPRSSSSTSSQMNDSPNASIAWKTWSRSPLRYTAMQITSRRERVMRSCLITPDALSCPTSVGRRTPDPGKMSIAFSRSMSRRGSSTRSQGRIAGRVRCAARSSPLLRSFTRRSFCSQVSRELRLDPVPASRLATWAATAVRLAACGPSPTGGRVILRCSFEGLSSLCFERIGRIR
jgi:hypothetical protein